MNLKNNFFKAARIAVLGVVFFACENKNTDDPVGPGISEPAKYVVATTTNYAEGHLTVLKAGATVADTNRLSFSGDAFITSYEGSIYVIDRTRAVITKVIGAIMDTAHVDYQLNVGTGTNPQAIVFESLTRAYVLRYGSVYLLTFNPTTGEIVDSISLLSLVAHAGTENAAALPRMSCAAVANGKLYVACQRLDDNWTVSDTSKVAVIGTGTNAIIKTINLVFKNPVDMHLSDSKLYISGVGSYGDPADGGLEEIDIAADTSVGGLISEAGLGGGSIGCFVVAGNKGYISLSNSSYENKMIPFRFDLHICYPALNFIYSLATGQSLVYDGEYVYAAEASSADPTGIVVVDPSDDAKVCGPISTGLAPYALTVLEVE